MQRGTLALVIAALLCGGGFLAYEFVLRQGRQAQQLQDQRLLPADVTLDNISALSLLTNDGIVAIAQNDDESWQIPAPMPPGSPRKRSPVCCALLSVCRVIQMQAAQPAMGL